MVIISSSVVELKKIDSRNDPDRKSLCEQAKEEAVSFLRGWDQY